jgi:ferredoxin
VICFAGCGFGPQLVTASDDRGEVDMLARPMRIVVDLSRCQGYAQCCFLAPKTFKLVGLEALMYDPNPDDAQRESTLRAAAACPVQAILIDRVDDREKMGARWTA